MKTLAASLALLLAGSAGAGSLVPCPDCGKNVSRRAVSCPNCGCPGAAIVAHVAELARAARPKPNAVRAMVDGKALWALPMRMDGRAYAVLPIDGFIGFTALYFRVADGSRLVRAGRPEVARTAPVVRFPLDDSTNRVYWTIGGGYAHTGCARPSPDATVLAGFVSRFATVPVDPNGLSWDPASVAVFRDALSALAARQRGEPVPFAPEAPTFLKSLSIPVRPGGKR